MSEGNNCIAEPKLEVLPFAKFSIYRTSLVFLFLLLKVMILGVMVLQEMPLPCFGDKEVVQ